MKVALAQVNTTVGDIRGNSERVLAAYRRACALGAGLVLAPELALTGYPPRDLLEQPDLVASNLAALGALARKTGRAGLCVGYVEPSGSRAGKPLYNAAALLAGGRVVARRFKSLLPTYDVFDEARYFEPARDNPPIPFRGVALGLTICEDAWNDASFWRRRLYGVDPVRRQARAGARALLNISSSPFHRGKGALRLRMLRSHAAGLRLPMAYCNLVGGNDELIFDGRSLILDSRGRLCAQGRAFGEDLVVADLGAPGRGAGPAPAASASMAAAASAGDARELYGALVLGLGDYARKCGFRGALVGLSGGIDSSLVCALAAAALGPGRVTGVAMPSRFSSEGSLQDARELSARLGVRLLTIPIEPVYAAYAASLRAAGTGAAWDFEGSPGAAEQNVQARIRGALLMALSNKTGDILLSTGNKSELSVGYCTLYGDMSGGLSVIGDLPKTAVYELSRWINRDKEVIPASCLAKAPSAELRPGQKDQDDLPPYEVLDQIVRGYIEEGLPAAAIARRLRLTAADDRRGASPRARRALVAGILDRIDRNEYKRRQAAPALKITPKAFGVGRRMPIARGFHRKAA